MGQTTLVSILPIFCSVAFLIGLLLVMLPQRGQISGIERVVAFLEGEDLPSVATQPLEKRSLTEVGREWYEQTLGAKLSRTKRGTRLTDKLVRADLRLRASEWVVITIGVSVLFGVVSYERFSSVVAFVLGGISGYVACAVFLKFRQEKRRRKFDKQLGDTVLKLSGWIKGGQSFLSAVQNVADGSQPPMQVEFLRLTRELHLGVDLDSALQHFAARNQSEDLELLISAVEIQRQVGGNLAEVLDIIGEIIRQRVEIKQEVRALTATGRASGWIVTALPFLLGFFLFFISPAYFGPMLHVGLGQIMLGIAALMIGSGFFLIQKITNVKA